MGTAYSAIYEIITRKITDYQLTNLLTSAYPEDGENLLKGYLLSAIPKFAKCKTDLSDRDDTAATFNLTLTDYEKEILGLLGLVEWIEPNLNHLLLVKQLMGDAEFKLTSQANHLRVLIELKKSAIENVEYWKTQYTYDTSNPYETFDNILSDLG